MVGRTEDMQFRYGDGPVVAVAVHNGHSLREELLPLLALDEDTRRREEDTYTGQWTAIVNTSLVINRSRFEVDLNRPRDKAVYLMPEDAWGLRVWKETPPKDLIERSLGFYDAFYSRLGDVLQRKVERYGHFVLYDIHSYNHRRKGSEAPPEPREKNPDINLGTGSMDMLRWGLLAESFMDDMAAFDFPGGRLDVRENVKFRGGFLSQWVNSNFRGLGCALAIEVKKFFMDEWSGQPFPDKMDAVGRALASTLPAVLKLLSGK